MRDLLKDFYSLIKELDSYLQFVFLTGVSKFSKVSIFMGEVENIELSDEQMASFDAEHLPPAVLLFQSGYLTIEKSFQRIGAMNYLLKVPNREVRIALSSALFTG